MATFQEEKRSLLGAYFLIILLLPLSMLRAQQLSFEPLDEALISNANSGVNLAVGDINGDGLDDIARFDQAEVLQILLQLPSGKFKLHYESISTWSRQWNILISDLNNDGWSDVISSGTNEIYYWLSNTSGDYQQLRDDRYNLFSQAANLAFIDSDNIPDLFICNDVGESISLQGKGTFPWDRKDLIDFKFPAQQDFAGNYGSVWQDINDDGREDLYISKCFQTATSPSDPRRINQLFLSEGDTAFSEKAVEWGVADSAQSWASTFADVDNDGDWDLLVLNHDAPSALYYNEGGQFQKSTDFAGAPIRSTSVQVLAQDFNCDSWIDFLITGRRTELLINQGDGTFQRDNAALGLLRDDISTAASGDLNNDGYPDLMIARHDLYNAPANKPDRLLLNQGGNNHYLKLNLLDKEGKLSVVGAVCHLYTSGLKQMRSVRVGDSYGICHSATLHFGLGAASWVDSLVIEWADGESQIFDSIAGDRSYYIRQGKELLEYKSARLNQDFLCENDTVEMLIPDSFENVMIYHYESNSWDSSSSQSIFEEGNYTWRGQKGDSLIIGRPFYIPFEPKPPLTLDWDRDAMRCDRQVAFISADSLSFFEWNDGTTGHQRTVESSGEFFAILEGKCGLYQSDTLAIDFYPSIAFGGKVEGDTISGGNDALLKAEGDQLAWFGSENSQNILAYGNEVHIPELEKDSTLWVAAFEVFEVGDIRQLGESIHSGLNKYHDLFIDGALLFNTFQDCQLVSVEVQTDFPGKRGIQLLRGRTLVRVDTFNLDSGITELLLNWPLHADENYTIKTDRGISFAEFQSYSPKLYTTFSTDQLDLLDYPYTDGAYVQIIGTNYSPDEYYYFYNWQVQSAPDSCYSERVPVRAIVNDTTSIADAVQLNLEIFPNPVSRSFRLRAQSDINKGQLQLFSSHGQMVRKWEGVHLEEEFSVDGLADGWYIARFYYDGKVRVGRLLIVGEP